MGETYPCPSEMIKEEGKEVPNLVFKLWMQQDHLVLLAIQVIVIGTIATLMTTCKTSTKAWLKLETTFTNKYNT